TANFPAEYGRKMGGVIEVTTKKDARRGLHGEWSLSGGSFDTGGAYAMTQYSTDKDTFGVSASGDFTSRYLNPPVVQNFTNVANTGDFSARYERDFSEKDHLSWLWRHELARFDIPNEQVQQQAGQLQTGAETETSGTVSYQHIFSPNVLGTVVGMVRDDANSLQSNQFSTPILALQDRGFREGYVKGSVSVHQGRNEWKAGIEADFYNLHEAFSDVITDLSQFDPGTPASFNFFSRGYDREPAAFVQDFVRLGNWSLSAGVRWDHYQLLVDKNAVSPRLGVARYFPSADVVVHASYDRIFQTPAFENILLSSSPQVQSLNPKVLRLLVEPSLGNYYEVGMTKGLFRTLKFDTSFFERRVNNFADDDQLLNTAVSFPIAFNRASIYGAEAKLDLPHWRQLSGYVSYSYMVASAYFPVSGGLFLGEDASAALSNLGGRFWVSQDQRNTLRTRFRYAVTPRVWLAAGSQFGSGLPFEFDGTEQSALAQYGQAIVNRVDFETGRVRPSLSVDLSAGLRLYQKDNRQLRLQGDLQNLNNRLNVIDFAGLFSGNAVAPPRSLALRLTAGF
ncbi:MAG: TonB-dependent receptor, partial [Terriglobales bacterium]